MRVLVSTLLLVGHLLLAPVGAGTAAAQSCDWYPSSSCPARGITRRDSTYPCFDGQVKADWNTMLYRDARQSSYASAGFDVNADVWCFDEPYQAQEHGFRRAGY